MLVGGYIFCFFDTGFNYLGLESEDYEGELAEILKTVHPSLPGNYEKWAAKASLIFKSRHKIEIFEVEKTAFLTGAEAAKQDVKGYFDEGLVPNRLCEYLIGKKFRLKA